jgi:hypothetical protein
VLVGWRTRGVPDGLHVDQLHGDSFDLVPAADGGYRQHDECGSSVRFTTNRDGVPVLLMGFMYGEAAPWWLAWARHAAVSSAMLLVGIAPLWAAIVLGIGVVRRRRVPALGLVLWPAVSGLLCTAMPRVLWASFHHAVVGVVHPLTIALCAITILFAGSAAASLYCAVRWSIRPDRPRLVNRAFPTACAIAAFCIAAWFAANGLIGLRTWAW